MAQSFLSVKDAAKHTGKSLKTIYRLVEKVASNQSHPDRDHVTPDPATYQQLKEGSKRITYTVSTDLLDKKWPPNTTPKPADSASGDKPERPPKSGTVLSLLKSQIDTLTDQLDAKDDQLKRRDEQITDLTEAMQSNAAANQALWEQLKLNAENAQAAQQQDQVIVQQPQQSPPQTDPEPPKPQSTTEDTTPSEPTPTNLEPTPVLHVVESEDESTESDPPPEQSSRPTGIFQRFNASLKQFMTRLP